MTALKWPSSHTQTSGCGDQAICIGIKEGLGSAQTTENAFAHASGRSSRSE